MAAAKRTSRPTGLRASLASAVRRADRRLAGPRVILSPDAAKAIDRACTERFGIPSIVLMEHASLGLASVVLDAVCRSPAGVLIVAGPGNNGGDGLACARHLANAGVDRLRVIMIAEQERLAPDAALNLRMAEAVEIDVLWPEALAARAIKAAAKSLGPRLLVVDAMLGTGLSRPLDGSMLAAVRACNRIREVNPGCAVLAVDVPSGFDAVTGDPLGGGEAAQADATVTMAGLKPGMTAGRGRAWTGAVGVVPIGAPSSLLRELGESQPAAASRRQRG